MGKQRTTVARSDSGAAVPTSGRPFGRRFFSACAISGGPFKQGYNVLKGIDRFLPVDVHIPGCPPRPEALIHAFMTLQRKIDAQTLTGPNRPRHLDAEAPGEFPVPQFGEHDLVPPSNRAVWQPPHLARKD